jgi:hypothetical protein
VPEQDLSHEAQLAIAQVRKIVRAKRRLETLQEQLVNLASYIPPEDRPEYYKITDDILEGKTK